MKLSRRGGHMEWNTSSDWSGRRRGKGSMTRLQQFLSHLPLASMALGVGACSQSEAPIANPTFHSVQGVWIVNYQRVVSQETTPQVFDSRSFPTCSPTTQPPCTIDPTYFVLDTANRGQYSFALVPPSDPAYVPFLAGTASVANDSLILGATVVNCCRAASTYRLEVYASQMHLMRNWRLGGADAQLLGFTLPSGAATLDAVEQWWFRR